MIDQAQRRADANTIYRALLGNVSVGKSKVFHPHSAYRGSTPSLSLFEKEDENGVLKVFWYCHRNGHGGDAWRLLMLMLGTDDFYEALDFFKKKKKEGEWIHSDLNVVESPPPKITLKDHPDIYDLAYWARLGVAAWKLERDAMLYPRKVVFTSDSTYFSTPSSPYFGWCVGDGVKLYRPHEPSYLKHRNLNLDPTWVDGLWNIKSPDILYIVSSRKDRMIVDSGYAVINGTGGENNTALWETRARDLLGMAKNIAVLQDGDDAGWMGAQKIAKVFNSPRAIAIDTRPFYAPGHTDFGDVADNVTSSAARSVMKQIDKYAKDKFR